MVVRNRFQNEERSLLEIVPRSHSECGYLIESAICEHASGEQALNFVVACGCNCREMLADLDEAAHPLHTHYRRAVDHVLKQYREREQQLLQTCNLLAEIDWDESMHGLRFLTNGPDPHITKVTLRRFTKILADRRDSIARIARLASTETYRWGLLAMKISTNISRPVPWRQVAVLLEAAYSAHNVHKEISGNAVCQAVKHFRNNHAALYWRFRRIASCWAKGGSYAGMEQEAAEIGKWTELPRCERGVYWIPWGVNRGRDE
jgi:hypothetical protein